MIAAAAPATTDADGRTAPRKPNLFALLMVDDDGDDNDGLFCVPLLKIFTTTKYGTLMLLQLRAPQRQEQWMRTI